MSSKNCKWKDCSTCPTPLNPDGEDAELSGEGYGGDECPDDPENDADGDGICGDIDECPYDAENDADGDGICADDDECPDDMDGCTGAESTECDPDDEECLEGYGPEEQECAPGQECRAPSGWTRATPVLTEACCCGVKWKDNQNYYCLI